MLSLHEIESGWAFEDTLRIFSETFGWLGIRSLSINLSVYLSVVNSIIHGLFDCFQSAQVAITGFEIINYICNIHSTGFKLNSGPLRTGFMTERTLLVNHPGGRSGV